jgi:hypothetical protein
MAAASAKSLCGDYQLHFEQISKSCGAKISPVDVKVAIKFSDTNINIKLPGGFLCIDILDANYNAHNGNLMISSNNALTLDPPRPT